MLVCYALAASGLPLAAHLVSDHGCAHSHPEHAHETSALSDAKHPDQAPPASPTPHDPVRCSVCFVLIAANKAVAPTPVVAAAILPEARERVQPHALRAARAAQWSPVSLRGPPPLG